MKFAQVLFIQTLFRSKITYYFSFARATFQGFTCHNIYLTHTLIIIMQTPSLATWDFIRCYTTSGKGIIGQRCGISYYMHSKNASNANSTSHHNTSHDTFLLSQLTILFNWLNRILLAISHSLLAIIVTSWFSPNI